MVVVLVLARRRDAVSKMKEYQHDALNRPTVD